MKKPLNNFALLLWLLAFVYALLTVPEILEILRQPAAIESRGSANYVQSFAYRDILTALRSTIYGSGGLAAFGAIIELVDRIRWDAARRAAQTDPH